MIIDDRRSTGVLRGRPVFLNISSHGSKAEGRGGPQFYHQRPEVQAAMAMATARPMGVVYVQRRRLTPPRQPIPIKV